MFLKNLGFTLYYNASELLQDNTGDSKLSVTVGSFTASPVSPTSAKAASQAHKQLGFSVVAGIDFGAFRNIVTTAMRMLYERDSRRPFLPQRHWLMTSKFDMEVFLSAVVLEEQRQHELHDSEQEEDADDEDDGDEMDIDSPRPFTFSRPARSRYAEMDKLREKQKRAARERVLAAIGPKLEILRNMPFVIPFETRVQIFRQFVHLDKERRRGGNIDPDRWRMWILNQHGGPFPQDSQGREILGRHHAQIKRGQVFEDALSQFYELGDGLKEPIQITFVDQFGSVEAGIDGGGVTKEFLTSVTNEAFTGEQSLFVANKKNSFYPNPCTMDQRAEGLRQAGVQENSDEWRESVADLLRQYEFLGRIIGKCMYEGILIDIAFAGFFLLKWSSSGSDSSYRANINDLHEMDEELYQGMLRLKSYPGDVSELGLDFTINDQISLPGEPVRTVTRNLIGNGENIAVTNENRPLYISYVARHRLAAQPQSQTRAFLRGLGAIIDPAWLSMFNQNELQRLVGGDSSEIDIEDLRSHTVYSGVYEIGDDGQEHPTIKLFWDVMRSLADDERRDVLKYVTSTPRAPLLGFAQLSPRFSIRDGGNDQERLPSASTCVNLLKLPQYRNAATLRSKLLYAITSGAGFDLS
jgi:ubiquitin-protein ligase E3 C